MEFSPDGRYLLSNRDPAGVNLIDARTGRLLHLFRSQSRVTASACSPDGNTVAVAVGRRVNLWHSQTGQRIGALAIDEDAGSTLCLQFSTDSQHLAAVAVKILEYGTGQATVTFGKPAVVRFDCCPGQSDAAEPRGCEFRQRNWRISLVFGNSTPYNGRLDTFSRNWALLAKRRDLRLLSRAVPGSCGFFHGCPPCQPPRWRPSAVCFHSVAVSCVHLFLLGNIEEVFYGCCSMAKCDLCLPGHDASRAAAGLIRPGRRSRRGVHHRFVTKHIQLFHRGGRLWNLRSNFARQRYHQCSVAIFW